MLNRLTTKQIEAKKAFIDSYVEAKNAADGSLVDANANVTQKTLATLEAELYKFETIQLNRAMVHEKIKEMFGVRLANQYIKDIEKHLIYIHDETSLKPYCASITMFPFLFDGTKNLGGTSNAPTNLQSFCGAFVNLVYQVASNFAGAVATVEFLMYFDYFARKQYGENYLDTNRAEIAQELQGVVYALNQPSSARGDQSVFWNISLFDKFYFESLFENFRFPDGSAPHWYTLKYLQAYFMAWFALERRKEVLTFPVITAAMLVDAKTKLPRDEEYAVLCARFIEKGNAPFFYMSETADSLSSCCRLQNEIVDNTFSYSLGAGGVSTGSKQVITLNMNRFEQTQQGSNPTRSLKAVIARVQKYLLAHESILKGYIQAGLLPAYTAGYISLEKQFLTIGINGAVEAAEFLGFTVNQNQDYFKYLKSRLGCIKKLNKAAYKKYGVRFNTEFVPAESLGVKNAKWDKKDDLEVKRDCYNSYFYAVEDPNLSLLEKMLLHGRYTAKYLDGGSALHLNLETSPSYATALTLLYTAALHGVPYWTVNTLCTICNHCHIIDPKYNLKCATCGSSDVDYGTRVIGYLKKISNFSKGRQAEHSRRFYHVTV